jgi:hypothetical protein
VFLFMLVGPFAVEMNRGGFDVSPAAPTSLHNWAPGAGRGAVAKIRRGGDPVLDHHTIVDPTAVSTMTIDLDALPLPVVAQRPAQATQSITWVEQGAPAGDARFVNWRAEFTSATEMTQFFWTTMENPLTGSGTTELLQLPEEYADIDPTRIFPVALNLTGSFVSYVDYSDVDGYDAARAFGPLLFEIEGAVLDGARHAHRTMSP